MVMSWIYLGILALSLLGAVMNGTGSALSAAVAQGAQGGIELAVSMAGSVCLWSGVGRLMEKAGMTDRLARLISPLLHRVFPSTKKDPALKRDLSANICANFLGLGNAATPMGIAAARTIQRHTKSAAIASAFCPASLHSSCMQRVSSTMPAAFITLPSPCISASAATLFIH